MDTEVLEVLKEIRDEAKATNSRLDGTNSRLDQTVSRLDQTVSRLDSLETRIDARLESVEGRVGNVETRLRFVEKALENGLDEVTKAVESLAQAQQKREAKVIAELVSINSLLHADAEERKMEREVISDHEKRISVLEKRARGPKRT
jgi:chromosome segregation ATPase